MSFSEKTLKRIVGIRVIDRNRKNHFEIPAFLPLEQGNSRARKFKVMQHFAVIEICLCFHFIFPLLELLIRNSKRWYYVISKYIFLFHTLSSVYNPGWIWKIDKWNFFDSDDFYVHITLCTLGFSLNNEIFGLFYHFTIYVHFMQIHKMS